MPALSPSAKLELGYEKVESGAELEVPLLAKTISRVQASRRGSSDPRVSAWRM